MLNLRFLPMGVAAAPALRGRAVRRAAEGQAMVDASWALAARGEGGFDRELMLGATLPQYPAWVGGTALGVFFGDALGDPAALGLDAIFPAFFLGLLAAELGKPRAIAAALVGGAIALSLTPVLPAGLSRCCSPRPPPCSGCGGDDRRLDHDRRAGRHDGRRSRPPAR